MQKNEEKGVKEFQILHFYWSFSRDIVAVKGLMPPTGFKEAALPDVDSPCLCLSVCLSVSCLYSGLWPMYSKQFEFEFSLSLSLFAYACPPTAPAYSVNTDSHVIDCSQMHVLTAHRSSSAVTCERSPRCWSMLSSTRLLFEKVSNPSDATGLAILVQPLS